MKNRLILLHTLLLICFLTVGTVGYFGNSRWLISGLALTALILVTLVFKSWVVFTNELLLKSRGLVSHKNQRNRKSWLSQLEELVQNLALLERKFALSADMIANLSRPDKLEAMDDLLKDDPIGNAIVKIQQEIKELKEEDDRKAWIANGISKFSSVLRNKVEVKEYTQNILSYLVKYLNANQGSFYVAHEDEVGESYLELTACYAYSKKKFVEHKVYAGQGILGQCMLEKDFVFITDLPANYVKITSGLGEATPRNVVVAPLTFNEIFCGAIEIASFQILKPFEVEFLKKICEDIGSEIAAIKSATHTKQLLEKSNVLTQELQAQEEEMKQNMEELVATQEEISRNQIELSGIINAIDSTLGTAEFTIQGKITKSNTVLAQFLQYDTGQLLEKDFSFVFGKVNTDFWNEVIKGTIKSGDYLTSSKNGDAVWLSSTFTHMIDKDGNVAKILSMIQNITQKKVKEKEFERLSIVANNTDNAVLITDKHGMIEYVNEGFIKMSGYELNEIQGKKPGSFLQGEESNQETIARIRELIRLGKPVSEEILNYNKNHQPYWVSLAINPVFDEKGELINYISVQANITETKIASLEFKYKLEAISRSNTIIEFDIQGNILDANENYLKLTGYSLDEIVGKHHSIFLAEGSGNDKEYQQFWKQIAAGESLHVETSRRTKSGKIIWLRGIYNPIWDMNGKTKKIVKFAVDITKEHLLQEEAKLKQIELDSYLGGVNNTIASAEFDLDGKFIKANDIFLKVMGYTSDDLNELDYMSQMSDSGTAVLMWDNLKMGKVFSGEFRMKNREGKEFWLNGTLNPIIIANSTPDKILMLAQFTTQEKERMNDLNTLVHAFKSTLAIIDFNSSFSCKSANDKAMKLFGVTRVSLKSKSIYDFIAPYFHQNWENIKTEIMEMDFSVHHLPFSINSAVVTYEVSISRVLNLDGTVSKYSVLFVKEVSEVVRMLAVK